MALNDAIFVRLSNDSAITALVGNRIEPDRSTGSEWPLIVYNVEEMDDGSIGQDAVTVHYEVTIGIAAQTRAEASAVAAAVKAALNDQEWITGDTKVVASTYKGETRDTEDDGQNPESLFYTAEQTYSVYADH